MRDGLCRVVVVVLVAAGLGSAVLAGPAWAAGTVSCSVSSGTLTVAIASGSASDRLAVSTSSGEYAVTFDGGSVCTGVSDSANSTVVVSGTAPTTFVPGSDSGVTFEGAAGNENTLDASAVGGSSLVRINMGGDDSSQPGTIAAGSLQDSFTAVTTVDGSSGSGGTTFEAGSTSGQITIVGQGTANTLDLSAAAGGVSVSASFGSGVATPDSGGGSVAFSGIESFVGSSSGDSVFGAGAGSMSFTGQGAGNELTFAGDAQGIVLAENGDSTGSPGSVTTGNGSDTFAGINTLVGSASGQNDFIPGATGPGMTFQAGGSGNSIDLSALAASQASQVAVDAAGDASPLPDQVSGAGQTWPISGIQAFIGSSDGFTTFRSDGTNGLTFTGQGSAGNVLDLGTAPSGTTVTVNGDSTSSPGLVVASLSSSESFSGMQAIKGSSSGDTSFVAGTADVSFIGQGSGNSLDLSGIATSSGSPLTVDTGAGTVTQSGPLATFSGIERFLGAVAGQTIFIAGASGGFSFAGQGSGNELSFAEVPSIGGVTINLSPNGAGQDTAQPGSGTDTFTGITMVHGSPGSDTFLGGPGNYTVQGGGGPATLDESAGALGVNVSFSGQTATVTGGFSGTTTTTGVTTFVGSGAGGNTFVAPADGGYSFRVPSAAPVASTLDLTEAPGTATVSIGSTTGNGSVTGLSSGVAGSTSDAFQGMQSFVGLPAAITTAVLAGASPWGPGEPAGTAASDRATVSGVQLDSSLAGDFPNLTPTGTLDYIQFANGSCSGTPVSTQQVTLNAGEVPNSGSTSALEPGMYSYLTTYSGDGTYRPSTGACEAFAVDRATSSTATIVDDAGSNANWSGSETTGSQAYDTATVSGTAGVSPTGTVTYNFFTDGGCSGPAASTEVVTLAADGSVPNSPTTAELGAGNDSFQASYSGDSNYTASTSPCEALAVGRAASSVSTVVDDAATGGGWLGYETPGAEAYDSAVLDQTVPGFVPTGTVTYSFFSNGGCAGTAASTQMTSLDPDGSVPNSATTSALAVGSYSYQASYSGDGDYNGATGACEKFTVVPKLADVTASLSGPTTESRGSTFFETLTITDAGPAAATDVLAVMLIPRGVTVTSTGGGTQMGDVIYWTASRITPNAHDAYTVGFRVDPHGQRRLQIDAGAVSLQVPDPNLANNIAQATVTLNAVNSDHNGVRTDARAHRTVPVVPGGQDSVASSRQPDAGISEWSSMTSSSSTSPSLVREYRSPVFAGLLESGRRASNPRRSAWEAARECAERSICRQLRGLAAESAESFLLSSGHASGHGSKFAARLL